MREGCRNEMEEKILGLDYGRVRVGVAVAEGGAARPLKVMRRVAGENLIEEVAELVKKGEFGKVVVGDPGGEIGKEVKGLVEKLEKAVGVLVVRWDETMSSCEAEKMAREAGFRMKKRRKLRDAWAAAVMLQSYLENRDV